MPFWNSPKGPPARGVLMVHYWDIVGLTLLPVVVLSGTRKHGTTHMLRTDVAYGLGVIKFDGKFWKPLPAYRYPILTHSKEVRTFTWDRPLCQCPLRVVSNSVCRVHSRIGTFHCVGTTLATSPACSLHSAWRAGRQAPLRGRK